MTSWCCEGILSQQLGRKLGHSLTWLAGIFLQQWEKKVTETGLVYLWRSQKARCHHWDTCQQKRLKLKNRVGSLGFSHKSHNLLMKAESKLRERVNISLRIKMMGEIMFVKYKVVSFLLSNPFLTVFVKYYFYPLNFLCVHSVSVVMCYIRTLSY